MKKVVLTFISIIAVFLFIINARYILPISSVEVTGSKNQNNNLYLVTKNNKNGFINQNGENIIECNLINAREFFDGLAAIKVNNLIKQEAYINKMGKVVFNRDIDKTGNFYEGMALIWNLDLSNDNVNIMGPPLENLRYGYINKNGEIIVKPIFKEAENFSDGLAAVKNINNKWGFINKEGKFEIDPKFITAYSFNEGYAPVLFEHANVEYCYIDKKGNISITPKFIAPATPSEGLIFGQTINSPNNLVCVDYHGTTIFSMEGESAGCFIEGLAPVRLDDKWGFINKKRGYYYKGSI